jgi:hypothetical protein
LGTSGCGFLVSQATVNHYHPSDGVGGEVGSLAIRNAILVSNGENTANLVVTIVNEGDKAHNLTVQYESAGDKASQNVQVEAHSIVSVGTDGPTVVLNDVNAPPGSLFPVFMQYGNETGTELLVPVLDGSLPTYSTLVPTPTPTPTPAPTPTPTSTPSAEPTPVATVEPAPGATAAPQG